MLGAAVGLDVDDVRPLAGGERRRQHGAVALVLVALEGDLDVGVLLGELGEELRVLAAVLLTPRPEGQFGCRLRARAKRKRPVAAAVPASARDFTAWRRLINVVTEILPMAPARAPALIGADARVGLGGESRWC